MATRAELFLSHFPARRAWVRRIRALLDTMAESVTEDGRPFDPAGNPSSCVVLPNAWVHGIKKHFSDSRKFTAINEREDRGKAGPLGNRLGFVLDGDFADFVAAPRERLQDRLDHLSRHVKEKWVFDSAWGEKVPVESCRAEHLAEVGAAAEELLEVCELKLEIEAIHAFGQWGALFFDYCADELLDDVLLDNVVSCVDLSEAAYVDLSEAAYDEPPTVKLCAETFTVWVKPDRRMRLGNNQAFRVLRLLFERAGKAVPHLEIVDVACGDSLRDVYPIVCRLKAKLRKGGCGALADCIQSVQGHYLLDARKG